MGFPLHQLLAKPTQAVGRYTYETGLGLARTTAGSLMVPAANAWEGTAAVASAPCLIISVEAPVKPLSVDVQTSAYVWLLAYDAQPNEDLETALNNNGLGCARYSWGPCLVTTKGGLVLREASELWSVTCIGSDGKPFVTNVKGFPFDRGVWCVLSDTPVIASRTIGTPTMHLTARVQAR